MKKINIIFFLILAMAVMACKQDADGDGSKTTPAPAVTPTPEPAPKVETEAEKKEREEKEAADFEKKVAQGVTEELTRRENEKALTELKAQRDEYKKKVDDAKKAYEATDSQQKKAITIPAELTDVKDTDLDMVYSGLGYDNTTIGNLHEVIDKLELATDTSNKTNEIKYATEALELLKSIGEDTKKVLEVNLSDAGLEKIKDSKEQIEKAKTALKAFTDNRDTLIAAINAQIGVAHGKKNDVSTMKPDLEKISDKTPNVTSDDTKGYYWSTYTKDIQAKANEIENLVK